MKIISLFHSEDISIDQETSIWVNGDNLEICPMNDFLHLINCGDPHLAEALASAIKGLAQEKDARLHLDVMIRMSM